MEPVTLAVVGAGLVGSKHARLIAEQPECYLVGGLRSGFRPPLGGRRARGALLPGPFRSAGGAAARGGHCGYTQRDPLGRCRGLRRKGRRPADREAHCRHPPRRPSRIVEVADAAGCRVLVGHHRRHNPLDSGSTLPGSRRRAGAAGCGVDDVGPVEADGLFPGGLAQPASPGRTYPDQPHSRAGHSALTSAARSARCMPNRPPWRADWRSRTP